MTKRGAQSGFTLVEIAIVLVIIGLLLGGILKGQELIVSARVRNIADQNSGVQAAYYGFIDRYRQVPGDWPATNAAQAIPGVTTGGNASGRLDENEGNPWTEALALWEHLSKAGFIQGNYVGGSAAPSAAETDKAPRNAFQGFLMLFESDDYADAGTRPVRLNLTLGRGIPVNVLRELDVKIDDGLPLSGVLRHALTTGATFSTNDIGHSTAACVDDSADPDIWDIKANEQTCNAIYVY
ncbi:MAG: prepilin-type N-terminal cleavage/methylation domain-containing protein [Gammaproteobacteria bacterium]|nr:prepilin-type N-terminal cleavage/methylation domain-containing protein [Gammaproteobacteria bacterium]